VLCDGEATRTTEARPVVLLASVAHAKRRRRAAAHP
jgi:hypothetical protein